MVVTSTIKHLHLAFNNFRSINHKIIVSFSSRPVSSPDIDFISNFIYQNGQYFVLKKHDQSATICTFEPESETKITELFNIPGRLSYAPPVLVKNPLDPEILIIVDKNDIFVFNMSYKKFKKIASFEGGTLTLAVVTPVDNNKLMAGFQYDQTIELIQYNPEFGQETAFETLDEQMVPFGEFNPGYMLHLTQIFCFNRSENFAIVEKLVNYKDPDYTTIDSILFGKLTSQKSKIVFLRKICLNKILNFKLVTVSAVRFILDQNCLWKIHFFGVTTKNIDVPSRLIYFFYDFRNGKLLHRLQRKTNLEYCERMEICEDGRSLMLVDVAGAFLSIELLG